MTARSRRSRARERLFLALFVWTASGALTGLGFTRSARAETIWTGPPIVFTKPSGADPTLSANQDAIVPGVAITRGNTRGLYNAATEAFFLLGTSPADTEWAWGLNNPAVPDSEIRATNFAALQFDEWSTAHGQQPLATLERPGVLHIISQDIYIDITMTAWTSLGSGGGFSYTRSTPPPSPVPLLGAAGQGTLALMLALGAGYMASRMRSS